MGIIMSLAKAPPAPSAAELTPPAPEVAQTEKEAATIKASEKSGRTEKAAKASEKASRIARESELNKKLMQQCGLEDDEEECGDWEGPQRIKTSLATPEQQAKYRALLAMIFTKKSLSGVRVLFHPDDVLNVMREVAEYFKSEPSLIEDVPFGITIVGDLHGQLHDLCRVFNCHAKDGKPGYECTKYIFLGDYVDRGRQSLEVIMALFCLKMLYPDDFFLLRGNHEFFRNNMYDGFLYEILDRYEKDTATDVYWSVNETFTWMSVAAIIGDTYFCAHGGLSPRAFTRPQLRGLIKPFIDTGDDVLVLDLCWADPAVGLKGTAFNQTRSCSIFFGLDTLVQALDSIGCVSVFRGHSVVPEGIDNQWGLCITVFTATAQDGEFNDGACIDIGPQGQMTERKLPVDRKRAERDHRLFPREGSCPNVTQYGGCSGDAGIATIQND